MKILHIAVHLGGGVGRFLSGVVSADIHNEHEFLLLAEPPTDTYLTLELLNPFRWKTIDKISKLNEYLSSFDVIQIEFWNHPLLIKFLVNHKLPKCRLLIYSHVSGIYAPNIIPKFLFDYADVIVLSTPEAMNYYKKQKNKVFIHEIGGVGRVSGLQKLKHNGINIAYIGTASFSKLHKGYINACSSIAKMYPDVTFMVATNDNNDHLQREAEEFGIRDRFKFYYMLDDISNILRVADIFGYPLRKDHYGTGEQSIIEAMGSATAPVVIGNPAELSLIIDGYTGIVAKDIYDYVGAIKYCIDNKDFTVTIGERAKKYADENYNVNNAVMSFDELYKRLMKLPKKDKCISDYLFRRDIDDNGWYFYKLFLGDYLDMYLYESADNDESKKYFRDKIMRSSHLMNENKGGMRMYLKYFPDDIKLNSFLKEG